MPFVKRDKRGGVLALYRERSSEAQEYLPTEHPDVQQFAREPGAPSPQGRGEMSGTDLDMIRVYEDLIDILVSKRVVVLTDFPPAAQAKLVRRKRLRTSFSAITEVLLPDDEGGLP